MRGIDTNVLVRYVMQDEPRQSKIAAQFIEQECSAEEPAFINGVVLSEFVWVLESAYDYRRQDIGKLLELILRTRQFYIHQPDIIWQALNGYQNGLADFADNLIACLNEHNDCQDTVTFDKKASRIKQLTLLG